MYETQCITNQVATLLEGAGCFFNTSKVNSQTFTLLWWKKCVKLAKNVKKVINKGIGTCFSEKIVVFGHILAEISENVILLHKNLNISVGENVNKIFEKCQNLKVVYLAQFASYSVLETVLAPSIYRRYSSCSRVYVSLVIPK